MGIVVSSEVNTESNTVQKYSPLAEKVLTYLYQLPKGA